MIDQKAFASVSKEKASAVSASLELSADPTSSEPGLDVVLMAFHPDPRKNEDIRLAANVGNITPSGEGVSFEETVEDVLTFVKNKSQTSKIIGDLSSFDSEWIGSDLGAVIVGEDRRTLDATPGGAIGVAKVRFQRVGRKWTTTVRSNATQAILATAGTYEATASVVYDDGMQHGKSGLSLAASPTNPGVNSISHVYAYFDPASLSNLLYEWRTSLGAISEQGDDVELIENEQFTVTDSAFETERTPERVIGWTMEPGYAGCVVVNTPYGTRQFTASLEVAVGFVSYETRRRHATLFSDVQGTAFVTVLNTDAGYKERISIQFGPPAGPKDITITIKDQISRIHVGAGILVRLAGVPRVYTTSSSGTVRITSIAPGLYAVQTHDPSGVYRDNSQDGLANDFIEVP